MGLAPYGDPTSGRVRKFMDLIYSHLLDVKEDGSIWVNQHYFNYSVGLTMVDESKWETLFGFPRRQSETEVTQDYCDMALAIQNVTEDIVSKMANTAKRRTGSGNLCLAGGVALNCVANGKLLNSEIFKELVAPTRPQGMRAAPWGLPPKRPTTFTLPQSGIRTVRWMG